ncbi:MAG: toll/interleukin-1 receptor domain-containing protein [Clostridia bacterium]|nr:toll/interleukin-1 receptor domain-containing protein [Clostridia bacterium]
MDNKNIFISYGHGTHGEKIQRLADDLRKYGFNVFFDVDYLKLGDWEQTIDKHIVACKYFLFFVSERSTSPDGYCLNELCRAGENNSVIIPILVDDSRVPLSINKYQRLFFKDCFEGTDGLNENKYKDFLIQLVSILSGNVKLGFADEDARLEAILQPISSKDFVFRYYDDFCGRKEAFQKFEEFVASPKNFFWIKARPGCGKTAFSSMLIWRYSEFVAAAHFCKFNNSDRANPKYIISSIAYQLAGALPEYKKKLCELTGLESVFEKNAMRIFEYLLIEPTLDLHPSRPVVIVIDALDECSWRGDNELCKLLQRMRGRIPAWMKFVMTSRDEADIRRYLSLMATSYTLSDTETDDDLREYYRKQFPHAGEDKIDVLVTKAEGSFLYASEIVKQIKEENLTLDDIHFFPVGIYGFFNDCFLRMFGSEAENEITYDDVKPLLEFLCISQEPVDVDFLEEYLEIDEYRINQILALISGMFPVRDRTIEPVHKSLVDWLTDSHDVGHIFYVSRKSGYKRLLSYIEGKYASGKVDDPYVMKYFGDTLIALKSYERLAEILNDYELQRTVIEKLDFDSGLERYLLELKSLHENKSELCVKLLSEDTFIKLFSAHRRLLYNSGMFFTLKSIGLSVALRTDNRNWGLEGEVGKVFYYYIVEDFAKAIKKAKTLLASDELKTDYVLQSELYNVKGLSERKLVLFDDALESFENCIAATESVEEAHSENSDTEFELSLAHLIKAKIYLAMLDFSACNKNCKKAIKILARKVDEMPDCDKRTSNILFLAEDYRVFADALIWQGEYEEAADKLKECQDIYQANNGSVDRYYIRYKYTSLLLHILQKESDGAVEELEDMLAREATSSYDKGRLYHYIALCIYLNGRENPELVKKGFEAAKKGVDTFDGIDALLEKAECDHLAQKLAKMAGARYMSDDDENEYVDAWIEYVDGFLQEIIG